MTTNEFTSFKEEEEVRVIMNDTKVYFFRAENQVKLPRSSVWVRYCRMWYEDGHLVLSYSEDDQLVARHKSTGKVSDVVRAR